MTFTNALAKPVKAAAQPGIVSTPDSLCTYRPTHRAPGLMFIGKKASSQLMSHIAWATLVSNTAKGALDATRGEQQSANGKLRILGFGTRGAHVASRLESSRTLLGVDVWSIESESEPGPEEQFSSKANSGKHNASSFYQAQAQHVSGSISVAGAGAGTGGSGDAGVALVIASASGTGNFKSLVSTVSSLRANGVFTAVAIAMPFDFEGARKIEVARKLVGDLEDAAHFVTVVEQNALLSIKSNTSGVPPMTVDEATLIADNALEQTVRCVVTAMQASELLTGSKGALVWHGMELQQHRRLLPSALQQLLSQPGKAALGRGAAAMSQSFLQRKGECQTMMQLASDAVQAAMESPFLEPHLHSGRSAVCCVEIGGGGEAGQGASCSKLEHAAYRLAVQAAAGRLMQLSSCSEVVLCYTARAQGASVVGSQAAEDGGPHMQVEVSLLIWGPSPASSEPWPQATSGQNCELEVERSQSSARRPDSTSSLPKERSSSRSKGQRLPASAWGALSAMAGGGSHAPPRTEKAGNGGRGTTLQKAKQGSASRGKGIANAPQAASKKVKDVLTVSANASVGDQLADKLVAQSLDLPPKAAKWRQSQRAKAEHPRLMVQAPEAAWQEEDNDGLSSTLRSLLGGPQQEFDIRERTFAILERDRGDAWEDLAQD